MSSSNEMPASEEAVACPDCRQLVPLADMQVIHCGRWGVFEICPRCCVGSPASEWLPPSRKATARQGRAA